MQHKYDKRGASVEGQLAENLFREVCRLHKQNFLNSSLKEDCAGVDGYLDGRPIDVKARKNRIPANTCWVEVSKAGGTVGTGWAYHDKYIAQQMVYEEDNKIIKMQYGIYYTPDMVELMKRKVNFKAKAEVGTLYELYTRWWNGEHRGTMTVVPYSDLESLPSFQVLVVPPTLWSKIKAFYKYD
jgi:hypothetical protein